MLTSFLVYITIVFVSFSYKGSVIKGTYGSFHTPYRSSVIMPGSLLFSDSEEDIELNHADFEMPSLARLRSKDLPDVDDEVASVPLEITPETGEWRID